MTWILWNLSNSKLCRRLVLLAFLEMLSLSSGKSNVLLLGIYLEKNKRTSKLILYIFSGRYDIKVFQSFFQLHGKTFDYKIPMSTVLRMFVLPHKDSRQMFFVVSLDPPIKQGQTRYHFLVLLFGQEDETSIELPFTE